MENGAPINTVNFLKEYFEEFRGAHLVLKDAGFAVLIFQDKECLIDHVYVEKNSRHNGVCREIAEDIERIAKERGCEILTCCLDVRGPENAESAGRNLKIFLKSGYKVDKVIENSFITFVKEIN